MNKEFIKDVYNHIKWNVEYHTKDLIDEQYRLSSHSEKQLRIYSFLKRLIDSVISPLEPLIPETKETNNKN